MNIPLRSEDMKARIKMLEERTNGMEVDLKVRFKQTYESFTPGNLLKNAFSGITSNTGLLNTLLKLGLGYFGGRLFWNPSGGITKKAIGAVLQLGSSNEMGKKLSIWKNFVVNLFTKDKKAA